MNMARISVLKGDITRQNTDAIVNAANTTLLGGGGVDGAIHRAAGPELLDACRKLHGCKTGEAKITEGFGLPAKYVIHTVGPVWNGGENGEPELLRNAYQNSLLLALENGLKTISFPNISTGVYHFPKDLAARIATETVKEFIREGPDILDEIVFVCFDDENEQIYRVILG